MWIKGFYLNESAVVDCVKMVFVTDFYSFRIRKRYDSQAYFGVITIQWDDF